MRIALRQGLAGPTLAAGIVALTAFTGDPALAESGAGDPSPAAVKCLKAEVNPVTGHVLCIDPIGAPVDPPPTAELPCKPDARSSKALSYGPRCKS